LIVVGLWLGSGKRAWSQDSPSEAEASKQPTPAPAPADAQQEPAPVPAPRDAQKKPAAPAPPDSPKPTAPPAAPRDEQKERAPASTEALSARYRFSEKYSPNEDPEKPDLVTQYRVGIRFTHKRRWERAQGAPEQSETSRQTIYTERAHQVSRLGELTDAIRRYDYDAVRTRESVKPPSVQGLTIAYRHRPGEWPLVLSLSSGRSLRESDYDEISRETFLPQLMALFPPTPSRVGDTWEIPARVAKLIWREQPDTQDYELTGRLIEVGKADSGTGLTAIIGIAGRLTINDTLILCNAKIHFTFGSPTTATAVAAAPAGPGEGPGAAETGLRKTTGQRDQGVIEARGRINLALMAQTAESFIPGTDDRLKQYETRELVVERRSLASKPNAQGAIPGLDVPEAIPADDEANSWLVYDDPRGRFNFRHPQALGLSPRMLDPNIVEFVDRNLGKGQDVFILRLRPGAEDPQRSRLFCDTDQFQRDIDAEWARSETEIVRGPAEWLPAKEWAPLKVYRKELGVKAAGIDEKGGPVTRVYIDYYLVQSRENECLRADSMTKRNNHVAFRTEVERMLRSFQFGRSAEKTKASPVRPSPSSPPRSPSPP
jgi:hypothetical protein